MIAHVIGWTVIVICIAFLIYVAQWQARTELRYRRERRRRGD